MAKRLKTMFDGNPHCDGIPVGRRADVLATQKDHITLAWHSRGNGIGQGDDLFRYRDRAELIAAWRKQEAVRLVMQPPKILPVVPVALDYNYMAKEVVTPK